MFIKVGFTILNTDHIIRGERPAPGAYWLTLTTCSEDGATVQGFTGAEADALERFLTHQAVDVLAYAAGCEEPAQQQHVGEDPDALDLELIDSYRRP